MFSADFICSIGRFNSFAIARTCHRNQSLSGKCNSLFPDASVSSVLHEDTVFFSPRTALWSTSVSTWHYMLGGHPFHVLVFSAEAWAVILPLFRNRLAPFIVPSSGFQGRNSFFCTHLLFPLPTVELRRGFPSPLDKNSPRPADDAPLPSG